METLFKKFGGKAGFSLLETLVAISILVASIVATLTLTSQSINSASFSRNQIIAFNLAQEGVELIRSIRDSNSLPSPQLNWLSGFDQCLESEGCYIDIWQNSPNLTIQSCAGGCPFIKYDPDNGHYGYFSGTDTIFKRTIKLSAISSYEEKVLVTIEWQEAFATPSQVALEERIFDWKTRD